MNNLKFTLTGIIIALIFLFVSFVTYFQGEPKAYDFMTKHFLTNKLPFDNHKKVYGSDDIVLVVIDSKTVEKYRWPWKREVNCKIFEYLHNYTDAKLIIHDSVLVSLDKDYPESDKKFFKTLSKIDNLIVGFMPNILPWKDKDFGEKYGSSYRSCSNIYTTVLPGCQHRHDRNNSAYFGWCFCFFYDNNIYLCYCHSDYGKKGQRKICQVRKR